MSINGISPEKMKEIFLKEWVDWSYESDFVNVDALYRKVNPFIFYVYDVITSDKENNLLESYWNIVKDGVHGHIKENVYNALHKYSLATLKLDDYMYGVMKVNPLVRGSCIMFNVFLRMYIYAIKKEISVSLKIPFELLEIIFSFKTYDYTFLSPEDFRNKDNNEHTIEDLTGEVTLNDNIKYWSNSEDEDSED